MASARGVRLPSSSSSSSSSSSPSLSSSSSPSPRPRHRSPSSSSARDGGAPPDRSSGRDYPHRSRRSGAEYRHRQRMRDRENRERERERERERKEWPKQGAESPSRDSSSSGRSSDGNPNPRPRHNSSPSNNPNPRPKSVKQSRERDAEKEPGELSSGSRSDNNSSGGEMEVVGAASVSASKEQHKGKRKFTPIVWDLEEKQPPSDTPMPVSVPAVLRTLSKQQNPASVSRARVSSTPPARKLSPLNAPPPASTATPPIRLTEKDPAETLQDSSPRTASPASLKLHPALMESSAEQDADRGGGGSVHSDGNLESGQLLHSPMLMDDEEESMPHINIAASRWADEEISPPREGKKVPLQGASKRIKRNNGSLSDVDDNHREGGYVPSQEIGEHAREKTESIAGVGNREDETKDLSNDEGYERETTETELKEPGEEDTTTDDEEIEQREEEEPDEEKKLIIPSTLPQRAIDMLQGCRSVDEFERLNKINEGTYGVVYRARNKKTGEIVALKKVKMEKEREGFPLTSLREINVLLSFHHPSIVDVKEVVVGSNLDSIFMVMEYMEHDLKGLMETMKQPFSQSEVKCLMLQLLEGVRYLHDNWVLHRDLKTSNLLLNNRGELKICDFGLARQYGSPLKSYTHMVVTLWYRAPELLLGAKQYSTALDMWSVGCIMAELLSKDPLFNGKNEIDQLDKIFKILGTPNEKIWPDFPKLPVKCNFTRQPYNKLKEKFPPTPFSGRPTLSQGGLDLLNRLLAYDPKKRITAEEALQHEWFKDVPLPLMKELMPTFPARSEHDRRTRRLMKSPDPLEELRKRELLQAEIGPVGLFG